MDNKNTDNILSIDADMILAELLSDEENSALLDFGQQFYAKQLREFKSSLIALKAKDDEIERCFEEGREPSEELTNKFEEMKELFIEDVKFFKKKDCNLFNSKDGRTLMSYVRSIIYAVYNGTPDTYVIMD